MEEFFFFSEFRRKLIHLADEINEIFGIRTEVCYSGAHTDKKGNHFPAFGKLLTRLNSVRRDLKSLEFMKPKNVQETSTESNSKPYNIQKIISFFFGKNKIFVTHIN